MKNAFYLLLLCVILCACAAGSHNGLEKRALHRIILREEITKPKRHRSPRDHSHPKYNHTKKHHGHSYDLSLENVSGSGSSENSQESSSKYNVSAMELFFFYFSCITFFFTEPIFLETVILF